MNLLDETRDAIRDSGHAADDIVFIGSAGSGHCCTWDKFCDLANFDYDSGYGAAQVATDLRIVFKDGQQMWRGEYDGSEWWEFSTPFLSPTTKKEIHKLFAEPKAVGWCSLDECNLEPD